MLFYYFMTGLIAFLFVSLSIIGFILIKNKLNK